MRQLSNQQLSLREAFTICRMGESLDQCKNQSKKPKQQQALLNTRPTLMRFWFCWRKTSINCNSVLGRKDNHNVLINIYFQKSQKQRRAEAVIHWQSTCASHAWDFRLYPQHCCHCCHHTMPRQKIHRWKNKQFISILQCIIYSSCILKCKK